MCVEEWCVVLGCVVRREAEVSEPAVCKKNKNPTLRMWGNRNKSIGK